jgi:hypothetical protein
VLKGEDNINRCASDFLFPFSFLVLRSLLVDSHSALAEALKPHAVVRRELIMYSQPNDQTTAATAPRLQAPETL